MATVARQDASRAARLAAFFKARPGVWIDGVVLGTVAGKYGWRSRISDCRRPPFNLRIENRQRRLSNAQGEPFTISEYRYVGDSEIEATDDWMLLP